MVDDVIPLQATPPVPGQVAVCRWGGDQFHAEYIGPSGNGDGRHVMRAHSNTPRFSSGTEIGVHPGEIVEWLPVPPPPEPAKFVEP